MPYSGRKKAIAAAALIGVAVIGLHLLARTRSAPEARNIFPERKAAGAAGAQGLADAASRRVGAFAPLSAGLTGSRVDQPMTLDEFIGLLSKAAPPELAEQVKREFRGNVQLQQAWNVYQNLAGPKAPAVEFVAFIGRIPEFRRLAAKFQGDPGFKQLFAEVAKNPGANSAVRAAMKNFNAAGSGPGDGTAKAEAITREWRRKAVSGVDLSKYKLAAAGPMATLSRRDRMPAATSASVAAAAAGAPAGAGAATSSGQGDATAAAKAAQGAGPDGKAGKDAHNAQKLDNRWKARTIDDDANFADDRKWITKVLLALKESTRKAVQPLLESLQEDLWGACYVTGNYDECRAVCQKVPEAECEDKDRWEACRSAGTRSSLDCVRSCIGSGGALACEPHRNEWDPLCAGKDVGQDYCLAAQAWGPEVCLSQSGITRCTQPTGTLDGGSGEGRLTAGTTGGPAVTCGSGIEMSAPPCQRLAALLAQVRAQLAAAAAAAVGPSAAQSGPAASGDVALADNYEGQDYVPGPGGGAGRQPGGGAGRQPSGGAGRSSQSGPTQSHFWENTLGTVGKIAGTITPLGPIGGWLGEKGGAWVGRMIDNGTVGKAVSSVKNVAKKIPVIGGLFG